MVSERLMGVITPPAGVLNADYLGEMPALREPNAWSSDLKATHAKARDHTPASMREMEEERHHGCPHRHHYVPPQPPAPQHEVPRVPDGSVMGRENIARGASMCT